MNAPKNEWVLCHSKSFPGKLYYFNVANGETVWSLNSNEKNSQQKGIAPNIKKPNPRTQGYPEPTTPPDQSEAHQTAPSNNCPSTSNQWQEYKRPPFQNNHCTQQPPTYNPWPEYNPFQNGNFPQQIPAFGQPAQFVPSLGPFMPGMPNMGMPNVGMPTFIWTPVPLPTPGWPQLTSNEKLPQLTSNEKLPQAVPIERDLFVHSSGGSLSQKFVNYEKPTLYFNKEKKKFYVLERHKSFESSTPIKQSNSNVNLVENQASTSQYVPEQNILNTESNIEMNNVTGKSTLDTSDTVEIPDYYSEPGYQYSDNENSTVCERNKVQCPISQSDTEESSKKDTGHLHKHDLRFVLIAKKRKLAKRKKTQREKSDSSLETKKVKLEECNTPLKKRVTFDLNNQHETSISADDENEDDYQLNTPKSKIKKSYKIPMSPTQSTLNNNRMLEKNKPKNDNIGNSNNKPTHDIQAQNMPVQNMSKKNLPKHFLTQQQYTVNNAATNTENTIAKTSCKENKILVKTHSNKKVQTMEDEQDHSTTITTNMPKSVPLQNNMPIKNQIAKNKNVTPEYDSISTTSLEASNSVTLKESADELPMGKGDRIRKPWYLVVDMDVLLDDLEMVDGLLKSDDKCRLLIPHCMRTELDALCIGDCRGQKRVFIARQLSRRMTTPQEQCIVEPPTEEDANNSTTTHDAILNSCIRVMNNQQFVVLITNDSHLKATASTNNIRCFSTEEIQNGAIVRPKLFSELKKIRVIVDNHKIENNIFFENQTTGKPVPDNNIPVDTYKRELFANSKNTERNDLLIDITKPKTAQKRFGTDCNVAPVKINNVQQLNSKDKPIDRDKINIPPSEADFKENHVENVSNVCNFSNEQTPNKIGSKIRLCRSKLPKQVLNKSPGYVENDKRLGETDTSSKENQIKNVSNICNLGNEQNSNKFNPKQNSETYKNIVELTSKHHNTHDSVLNNDNFNISNRDHEVKVATTVEKRRIEKIMHSALNTKSPETNEKDTNQHSWQTFKIPRLSSKKGTTSALNERTPATDEVRSNFKTSEKWLEEHLKNYNIKSAMMHDKLTTRMEEWTCTFTQIMENVLDDVLQINANYVDQVMVSDRILPEMLTCIKMLYDDARLRDVVGLLVEYLNNYTCSKGKFKLDTPPQDFMKILGCGVVLVQVLQTTIPHFEGLSYYESLLDCLVSEIGSKTIYLDPELLRPTAVCRSEIDDTNKEARQYFAKNPSMIIEYLKKHYKEWSAYDERRDGEASVSEISPNGDTKVVRIFGKNINMLKIDNKKSFSYDKTAKDNTMSRTDAETKLVRLLGIDNPNSEHMPSKSARPLLVKVPLKQHNIVSKESQSKIKESDIENDNNTKETKADQLTQNTEPKIISLIENINLSNEDIYEEHGHTFATINDKTTGPKVIRNFKIIDEHEKKNKNKEPLDLDMLDYSEINDNSNETVYEKNNENDECNVVSSEKSNIALKKYEKCDNANNENYINGNDKNKTDPLLNNVFYYHTRSKSKEIKQEITTIIKNNENDTMIKKSDDSAIINDINTTHNSKDDFTIDLTNDNDCVKKECNETKEEINNDNDMMNPSRDDSTNDSGFENESSQAYSLVQIFLMELGSTLKEIYRFIYDFVKVIREEALCEERKNLLYSKSNKCLQDIRDLIQQLKSIIERESNDDTAFKTIIFRSSVQATKDPKITRYRQIIKKCLMQAEILQKALEVIVCVTMGDLDGISDNVESINSSFKYFII